MLEQREWIDEQLSNWIEALPASNSKALETLKRSMQYSLTQGGKRFRPLLSLMVAESFGVSPQRIFPWACAIELIHTYSLIHDDLPCMDDDHERRGQPTNHKVYGESTALLAGDTLLTEAFGVIAESYKAEPHVAVELIQILVRASGISGMAGGQAIDLLSKLENLDQNELKLMHEMKTGALIRASVEGAAVVCGLRPEKRALLRKFGRDLGLAFQLQDDLLDSKEEIEAGSFPALIGLDQTRKLLQEVSASAAQALDELSLRSSPLNKLLSLNLDREH